MVNESTRLMKIAESEAVREVLRYHGVPPTRAYLRLTVADVAAHFEVSARQLCDELQEALEIDEELEGWPEIFQSDEG